MYAFQPEGTGRENGVLRRVQPDGTTIAEAELSHYERSGLLLAADAEQIAVYTGQYLTVYNYELEMLGEYPLPTGLETLQWDGDGFLYARNFSGMLWQIDPAAGKTTGLQSKKWEAELQYGNADCQYRTAEDGLYRASETGDILLLDWKNNFLNGDSVEILAIRDDDRILAKISDPLTGRTDTVILSRVPEDALPSRQVVTLAYFQHAADRETLELLVNAFNRDQELFCAGS